MNTTSHIEAFNAELMDAKREALAAIRAIVRTSNPVPTGETAPPTPDPRILAQARMAATQVLRTAFLKPLSRETGEDRFAAGGSGEGKLARVTSERNSTPKESAATPAPAPESHPSPADQRRAQQIERIAQQAARDLERYQQKISHREERERRRAAQLASRAGAGSTA